VCFFSRRRRHTRFSRDWSSDVCSSDLTDEQAAARKAAEVEVLRATLKAADDEHARAREAMTRAHEEARAAEARLEAARAEREGRSEERRVGKERRPRGWP